MLIILKIHVIVSYAQNIIFVKIDSMSGCGIRLVFNFSAQGQKTVVQKMRTSLK